MTPVSIPPDPYQLALKQLREAREEIRLLREYAARLEEAGGTVSTWAPFNHRIIWTKAKETKP